jgi:hypothetical protein
VLFDFLHCNVIDQRPLGSTRLETGPPA